LVFLARLPPSKSLTEAPDAPNAPGLLFSVMVFIPRAICAARPLLWRGLGLFRILLDAPDRGWGQVGDKFL
jgi:hypothetical protein